MGREQNTVFMLIERKLKKNNFNLILTKYHVYANRTKIISILTFVRFSGKGHYIHYVEIHYEKFQNTNFLALIRSCIY